MTTQAPLTSPTADGMPTTESKKTIAPLVDAQSVPVAPILPASGSTAEPLQRPSVTSPIVPPAPEPPLKKMRVSELLGVTQAMHVPVAPDENSTLLTASGDWTAAEAITKSIPRDQGVPMTILTGFLGAGKSTVLNYILSADHGLKIAVLINEFGEVDIDNQLVDTMKKGEEGEPIMLNNGCVCCTISNGFAEAVSRTLEEADARGSIPDYFIVETTGLADPKPIIEAVSMTELNAEVYIDQVLTVVDSSVWTDDHYSSNTAVKQIEAADTVLLSKTDLIESARVDDVVKSVCKIRASARILRSQRGYVPIAALFDLGVSASAGRKRRAPPSSAEGAPTDKNTNKDTEHKHEHGHTHTHEHGEKCGDSCSHKKEEEGKKRNHLEEEGFSSISFVSEFPFSLRRFKDEFMEMIPASVFRAKGLLWFVNQPSRFIFHWSGQRYQVDQDVWPEGAQQKNQLVIIGRQLDRDFITRMLEHCVVKPGEESDEEEEEEEDEEGELNQEELAALAEVEGYEEEEHDVGGDGGNKSGAANGDNSNGVENGNGGISGTSDGAVGVTESVVKEGNVVEGDVGE